MINKLIIDDYNVELTEKTEMPYSYTFPQSATHIVRYGIDGDDEICAYAFEGCTDLTFISFPEEIKRIKRGAFKGCTSLEKVPLSPSIEYIGKEAFDGCKSLKELDFEGTNVPEVYCTLPSQTNIYVPDGSKYEIVSYDDLVWDGSVEYFLKDENNVYKKISEISFAEEFTGETDEHGDPIKTTFYRNRWDSLADGNHTIEYKNRYPVTKITPIDDNYVFGFTAGQTNTVTVNFTPEYATNLALTWKLSQNHYFTLNTNTGDPHTIEVTAKDESILGGATMAQETLTATAESGTNVKFTLIFNKA